MKQFLFGLPGNTLNCFKGRMIIWHAIAIILTVVLVLSGFDWWYFKRFDDPEFRRWMFPAAAVGFVVPLYVPLAVIATGYITRGAKSLTTGYALAQAVVLGLVISSTYKAFTGRAHPLHNGLEDITRQFHFGLLRGGMFWGWPSSHTTIAFAMAVTVFTLFPKRRWLGMLAIAYALYIGIGISTTIHWFSDFIAGAIIGTVIGTVVGRSFSRNTGAISGH